MKPQPISLPNVDHKRKYSALSHSHASMQNKYKERFVSMTISVVFVYLCMKMYAWLGNFFYNNNVLDQEVKCRV